MITFKKILMTLISIPNIIYNRILFRYKNVEFKSYPKINGKIIIRGAGKLKIGENVSINSSGIANPIGGDTRMVISISKNALVEIGDNVGMSNSAIICSEQIKIGDDVKIGGGVKIYDTDFHSLDFVKRKSKDTDIPSSKPVIIGNSCFIGAHSIILKGVSIGERSIIGAGSVITKSISKDEIWGGNPAKFIKKTT